MKNNLSEFEKRVALFVGKFEHMFQDDWEHTKNCLKDPDSFISESGDFITPGSFDEGSNWDTYRCLLEAYRTLCDLMYKEAIFPAFDEGDLEQPE